MILMAGEDENVMNPMTFVMMMMVDDVDADNDDEDGMMMVVMTMLMGDHDEGDFEQDGYGETCMLMFSYM